MLKLVDFEGDADGAWSAAGGFQGGVGTHGDAVFFINLNDGSLDEVHLDLIVGALDNREQAFLGQTRTNIVGRNSFECAEIVEYEGTNVEFRPRSIRERVIRVLCASRKGTEQRGTQQGSGKM